MTRILVRGVCLDCGFGLSAMYDLMQINEWLEADGPRTKPRMLEEDYVDGVREAWGLAKKQIKKKENKTDAPTL